MGTLISLIFLSASAVLTAGAVAFLIGKFNFLVTLRRQISTEMLQFDFTLRKQAVELRTMGGTFSWSQEGCRKSFFATLDQADLLAHRAVAAPLCDANLEGLAAAAGLVASCWKEVAASEDMRRTAEARLKSNAEMRGKISGLVSHYGRRVRKFPCRWVASASGFARLSPGNGLFDKVQKEMLEPV